MTQITSVSYDTITLAEWRATRATSRQLIALDGRSLDQRRESRCRDHAYTGTRPEWGSDA